LTRLANDELRTCANVESVNNRGRTSIQPSSNGLINIAAMISC